VKRIISFFILLATDVFALIISFHVSYFIRVSIIPNLFQIDMSKFFPIEHFYKLSYMLVIFILIFFYEKLYTRRFDFFEEFIFIVRGLFISVILIAVFIYFSRTFEIFARTIFVLMLVSGAIIVPLFRFSIKKILMKIGLYLKNALIIGNEGPVNEMMNTLKKLGAAGYTISDIIRLQGSFWHNPKNIAKLIKRIEEQTIKNKLDTLILISEGISRERLDKLINPLENYVKEIKIVSDSSYLKTIGVQTEYLDELLIMRMANNLLSPVNRFFKRIFDIVVSILAFALFLPFFLLISILIKFESKGPVFFIHKRFGREGKPFNILKFRSMYLDADSKLDKYIDQNPELKREWQEFKKLKSFDPRVTRMGKFLRRFSLDEFPQILNVLKGEMSIVGPRPYMLREKKEIENSAAIIFRVKSGLSGLWQIRGRSELSFEDRLKLDEFYVRNWSFFLDILIILKTFGVVLRGKGAY